MKKSHPLISICLLSCSMAFAQEGRPFPPRGAAGPTAESAAEQARRGIEKKDIRRGMVIARQGVYDPQTLQQIEDVTRQLVDAIGAGAKLTKADAARTTAPPPELQRMAAQVRQILDDSKGMVVIVRMTPASGGGEPICPIERCQYSFCVIYKNLCICPVCVPRIDSGSRVASSPGGQPAAGGADLLVVAAPPDASDAELQSLIKTGLSELRAMPESPQLVIKTKSTPL